MHQKAYFGTLPLLSALRVGSFVAGYSLCSDTLTILYGSAIATLGQTEEARNLGKGIIISGLLMLTLDTINAAACYHLISSSILAAPHAVAFYAAATLVIAGLGRCVPMIATIAMSPSNNASLATPD